MDPEEELFPEDARKDPDSNDAPAMQEPEAHQAPTQEASTSSTSSTILSRKESLMKSLAETLEAATAASGAAARSTLSTLAEKSEEAEAEAGDDDGIGELPQNLLSKRMISPDVELAAPSGTRSSVSENLRQSLAASLEADAAVSSNSASESSPLDFLSRQFSPMGDFTDINADSIAQSEPVASRSSSKESESVFSGISKLADRTRSKELLKKGSTASLLQTVPGVGGRVHRLDREELRRLGQEIKDIQASCQDRFVGKMDFFTLLSRMARIEEFMENQLGRGGSVTSLIENLTKESRMRMAENEQLHRQVNELCTATVGNTSRIRDDSHRVENAADHAFRTAKHLEEVSSDFSVTKEAFREDFSRMAKAVQVLATEFNIFRKENLKSDQQKAEQISSADSAIRELQKQMGKQELLGSNMEDGLEIMKQEVENCAKQAVLKKLERRLMDMQEESARLQEFVHSKFFELQDQERREMMAAFAARWDPYNRTRLFRKAFDGWVEFLRRMNKSREALAKVKQVYAKTHVTARLRSWWYLMQRDHTDNQFRRLSENLESQEARLESTRAIVMRREKTSVEEARSLQYRLIAVEKGLETAVEEKATKKDVKESFDEIERRLEEELPLGPVLKEVAEIKNHLRKLQEEKLDAAVADADREKVHDFCAEFQNRLKGHDETLKRKADTSENETKADARIIEQVLVLLAKQADQLASMVAHDFDQLRETLTRFLEISPDFRKACLAVKFEPNEQCVACRALPRKCVSDGVTGADGTVYKTSMETTIAAVEETQRVLADKLKYPLSLASNPFVGCTAVPSNLPHTDAVSDVQPLPLLRQILLAKAGWLAGKESLQDQMAPRKLVADAPAMPLKDMRAATPRANKRRPPSAQDSPREKPQNIRSYFPAVNSRGVWKSS